MSFQLTFDGGEVVLKKDIGTPNVVQGFITGEVTLGANIVSLPTEVLFQSTEFIQFTLNETSATIVWLKVSGTWRQATPFIKVSGTWRQATPSIKIGGTWR